MLTLAIPTSRFDSKLLPDLSKIIAKFGPYRGHRLILFPTEAVVQEANQFVSEVGGMFESSHVEPLSLGIEGWPIAPNRMFRMMAERIQAKYGDSPWLLFEPDCTPVKDGWLQDIELAYKKAGKPYFGCIVNTRMVKVDNRTMESAPYEQHMVGGAAAIYPPNAAARSLLLPSLDRQMPWSPLPLEPYDVRIRYEVLPHAAHNDLIAHRWGTEKYTKLADGGYDCADCPDNPPGTSHAAPVPANVVVVHGCKDGSLAKLVLGSSTSAQVVKMDKAPTPALAPAPTPAQTTVTSDSAETTTLTKDAGAKEEEAELKKPITTFNMFRIRKAIESSVGDTVATLAKALELPEEEVKAYVRNPDSGYKLGPRGKLVRK